MYKEGVKLNLVNFRVDLNIDAHWYGSSLIFWATALLASVFSSCDNWLLYSINTKF